MSFIVDASCALCGALTEKVLSLTPTPPANALESTGVLEGGTVGKTTATPVYPLDLHLCPTCGHLQLPVAVSPEELFRDYAYVSPPGMLDHWRQHAAQMIPRFALKHGDLVVDIGSNTGDLLQFYKDAGMRVLGIEPAKAIAEQANMRGISTFSDFFSTDYAKRLIAENKASWGNRAEARLVLANNVFAHVRDLRDFVEGVKRILTDDGVFIFEVHWRGTLVADGDWPSIYHEHLHYHAVGPLTRFLKSCEMDLFDVQAIDTHNGSIRCFARRFDPRAPDDTPKRNGWLSFLERENELGLFDAATYRQLHARIELARQEFRQLFDALIWGPINAGGPKPRAAVLGCPAKLTTLAYHLGLTAADIAYVVDDAPSKIGKLTPGKRWPIKPFETVVIDPIDIAIIGAYNYADSLVHKTKALCRSQGVAAPVFLNPFPMPRIMT